MFEYSALFRMIRGDFNKNDDPSDTKKIGKKIAQCRNKIEKGDPSDSSDFVCYV